MWLHISQQAGLSGQEEKDVRDADVRYTERESELYKSEYSVK